MTPRWRQLGSIWGSPQVLQSMGVIKLALLYLVRNGCVQETVRVIFLFLWLCGQLPGRKPLRASVRAGPLALRGTAQLGGRDVAAVEPTVFSSATLKPSWADCPEPPSPRKNTKCIFHDHSSLISQRSYQFTELITLENSFFWLSL